MKSLPFLLCSIVVAVIIFAIAAWIGNGVLLAAVGLSHAYTLLVAAAPAAYLVLFHPEGRRALAHLAKVALLAFGLMAFTLGVRYLKVVDHPEPALAAESAVPDRTRIVGPTAVPGG